MPNYGHTSAAASSVSKRSLSDYRYSSLDASERQKKNIVTGACLIIGNEILNGKVFEPVVYFFASVQHAAAVDS